MPVAMTTSRYESELGERMVMKPSLTSVYRLFRITNEARCKKRLAVGRLRQAGPRPGESNLRAPAQCQYADGSFHQCP